MKKNKIEIVLELEYSLGAIFLSDLDTGEPYTDSELVNNDKIICELNSKIGKMYNSYYEFDSHGEACYFNEEQYYKDIYIIKELVNQLKQRIEEINDGTLVVVDRISDCLDEDLKELNKNKN